MAILKVAQMGHPVLRMVSRELTPEEIRTPGFQQFCSDLLETMEEYDGAGLAAPQVHVLLRVAVLEITEERGTEFLINPKVTVLPGPTRKTWEGCLSVAGLRGLVERPGRIRVEALDRDGTPKALEVEGHAAVVVQHECDHLDGVLYVDKVKERSLVFVEEYRRWGPPEEFAEPAEEGELTLEDASEEAE